MFFFGKSKKNRRIIKQNENFGKGLRIVKTISVFLILAFLFFLPYLIQKNIKVKKLVCVSQFGECPEGIVDDIKYSNTNDLITIRKKLEKDLSSNFLVKDFLIQYQIPSTIQLQITLKKPKYAVYNLQDNLFYLFDKDGLILEISEKSRFFPVTVDKLNQNNYGEKVEDFVLNSAEITYGVRFMYEVAESKLVEQDLYLKMDSDVTFIISTKSSKDEILGAFKLIYSRLIAENKGIKIDNVSEVDLRYENPVLR